MMFGIIFKYQISDLHAIVCIFISFVVELLHQIVELRQKIKLILQNFRN